MSETLNYILNYDKFLLSEIVFFDVVLKQILYINYKNQIMMFFLFFCYIFRLFFQY